MFRKKINLFVFLSLLLFIPQKVFSENTIYYLNLDKVLNQSNAGKDILKKLEKKVSDYKNENEKKKKKLESEEKKLISQKNIISEEEFKKKLISFREDIIKHQNDQRKFLTDINKRKMKTFKKFARLIDPIILEYVEKNSIDVVMNKSIVIIAKKDFDITDAIMKLVNEKIKKVKLED